MKLSPPQAMTGGAPAKVSVLYGGAHLFKANAGARLGQLALQTLATQANLVADPLYPRVHAKLSAQAVDDLRIDFEDGYGIRPNEEEDAHAAQAGALIDTAATVAIGVRVNLRRPERTLRLFFQAAKRLPQHFVVTLPKVSSPLQVGTFVRMPERLEAEFGLPRIPVELMAETTEAILDPRALVLAGEGRVESLHFGAYDYLSELDVPANAQHLLHPFCDDARLRLKLSGARVVDGATSLLPLGGDVAPALALHEKHITHALTQGIYQGWDLHPAQLIARYFALYRFFTGAEASMRQRFDRFLADAARARASGGVFDDAATARGLANFYLRGHACGALSDLPATPHDLARYAKGDFTA